ncbi:MAG: galactokinase family protein [Pyrodictiaceae archaeon]
MSRPSEVLSLYRKLFGEDAEALVSAPGRLDFLNTHQDYKGLPVVGVGINLRTYIAGSRAEECRVYSKLLGSWDRFSPTSSLKGGGWFGDYLRASLKALKMMGYSAGCVKAVIDSDVPVGSGLASSAALTVAFIGLLNKLYKLGMSLQDIAEAAFTAENKVMGIPCGRLDQYSSAYGGVVLIKTKPPYEVEEIKFRKGVFVVADSGIRHSTATIHPKRQAEINEALSRILAMKPPLRLRMKLGRNYWEPRWEELDEDELHPYLDELPARLAGRILYTLRAHYTTLIAVKAMNGIPPSPEEAEKLERLAGIKVKEIMRLEDWDLRLIGAIMTYQHQLLSSLYDVSLPEIDKLVEEAVVAGAYGAKLSGAGLGGSIIALTADTSIARRVYKRLLETGAAKAWIVRIDQGLIEHALGG